MLKHTAERIVLTDAAFDAFSAELARPSSPTPRKLINELITKELLIHPPTSEAEVRQQYVDLLSRFSDAHGLTSRAAIEEAIRAHLISDHALLEEWI